jgi:hypothetical protein
LPPSADLLKPLVDDLMQHYLQENPQQATSLLAAISTPEPSDDWSLAWALRYLRQTLVPNDPGPARQAVSEIYANGTPPQHVADCLRYLDTIADLNKRMGELHDRGL